MFENISPTLLDTQDMFRIRFWNQNIFSGSKIRFFLTKITKENYQFFSIVLYSFPSVLYRALYKTIEKIFFKNTSFPYFKSYSYVRKHISDTSRHSRRVQNTILISKTYFGDENTIFWIFWIFWSRRGGSKILSKMTPPPGGGGGGGGRLIRLQSGVALKFSFPLQIL